MSARAIATALVALLVVASCAEQGPAVDVTKGQIGAELRDHTVTLTSQEVRAGEVTFVVRNRGGQAHNFVVIRTDLAPDKLAVDQPTQKASEEGRVGGLGDMDPGKGGNLRLDLAPGHYLVICNVPTHYQLGMRTELTVK